MEAVVYRGAGKLEIEDRVAEAPERGQVAIEVAYTGICGTDLHIFHGDLDTRVMLVYSRTAGAGADIAFEVSGAVAGVDTAVEVLTSRGRLVLVAIHPEPRPVDLHRFFWRELELLGARLYQRDDVAEAIRLLDRGAIPARQLISRSVPVHEVEAAFAALDEGAGVMKILLDWQESVR